MNTRAYADGMKIPLTQYGLPQVVLYPAVIIALMAGHYWLVRFFMRPACECLFTAMVLWIPLVILLLVLVWVLSFFRDPGRNCPQDASLLLSPADGRIVAVETLDTYPGFEGPVLRVEIFLSIFNVHINRVPCACKIGTVTYKPGKFLDARNPECSKVNEANEIELFRKNEPADRLLVRQISGAIARRIVCKADTDQEFIAGEKFGMIKFGSCTELYIPARDNLTPQVHVGEKVKAGITILAKYE